MIISNKNHTILKYSVNQDYILGVHERTTNVVRVISDYVNIDNVKGKFSTIYETTFKDADDKTVFIKYKSLSTMDFIIENENKDYLDLEEYQNEINILSVEFIKENCLNYSENLTFTKFGCGLYYHHLRDIGFLYQ